MGDGRRALSRRTVPRVPDALLSLSIRSPGDLYPSGGERRGGHKPDGEPHAAQHRGLGHYSPAGKS